LLYRTGNFRTHRGADVIDALRSYVQLASGLAEVSAAKAKDTAAAIVAQGAGAVINTDDITAQVQAVAEDLIEQGRTNREIITGLIKTEVDRTVGRMGFVREEELAAVRRHVQRLESQLPQAAGLAEAAVNAATSGAKNAASTAMTAASSASDTAMTAASTAASAARSAPKLARGQAPTAAPVAATKPAASAPAPVKKTVAAKSSETAAKKAPAKKAPAKKAPAKKAPAKKAAAKKAAAN